MSVVVPLQVARISFFRERQHADVPVCTITNGDGGSAASQFFLDSVELTDEEARAVARGELDVWLVQTDRGDVRGEYASAEHMAVVLLPPGSPPP